MAHSIKLLSVRGIITFILSLTLVYLFVTNTDEHITEYITIYMVVLNYMFSDDKKQKSDD